MQTKPLPDAVASFDKLPDSALIDARTLPGITGKHLNTVTRWVKAGILPAPVKLPLSTNRCWRVGEVRRALAGAQEA